MQYATSWIAAGDNVALGTEGRAGTDRWLLSAFVAHLARHAHRTARACRDDMRLQPEIASLNTALNPRELAGLGCGDGQHVDSTRRQTGSQTVGLQFSDGQQEER